MRKFVIFVILIFYSLLFSQLALDPYYHTNEEISEELQALAEQYPDIMKLEQIGVTYGAPYQEPLPIWAVKISDNVNVNEDEPALLYLGLVHAEEIMGVEITMTMINELLENYLMPPYCYYVNELENWFVPTYNPEGLEVVMTTEEVSWRKNQRDNNGNGVLDFIPGEGNDIDGVDMNRNYSFNWVHGDTLYCTDGDQPMDYYRGEAPFSEGGITAIKNLASQEHFIYSIAWHSSRTGNLSEKVFYSFEWDNFKQSPDFDHNQYIAESVAALIPTETGASSYEPSPSRGRKGSAHEWFYKEYGTTQLLIECCTLNLQPNADIAQDTVDRCKVGAYWLMKRALGYQTDAAMLTGHVTDAITGEPIVAEVIIEEKKASFFTPRLTDATYGRFWRQLNNGSYTLHIRKEGYEDYVESLIVNNSAWTVREVALQPIDPIVINGEISDGVNNLSGEIVVLGEYPKVIPFVDGNYQIETFIGTHQFVIKADGFVPKYVNMEFTENTALNLTLDPAIVLMSENFESGLSDWTAEGSWATEFDPANGTYNAVVQQHFFDNYANFYANNTNISLTYNNSISLHGVADDVVLSFDHKYYVEHEYDFCRVEISNNQNDWVTIAEYEGINQAWSDVKNPQNENVTIPLNDFIGSYINLRFRFTSDETQTDPGWWIDNVKIISSVGAEAPEDEVPELETRLLGNYPNPFNPETTIKFNLSSNDYNDVNLAIYNVKGQKVKNFVFEKGQLAASNSVVWNGKDDNNRSVASGVYFYKLTTDKYSDSHRMILLK
jgi:hypothetical protein